MTLTKKQRQIRDRELATIEQIAQAKASGSMVFRVTTLFTSTTMTEAAALEKFKFDSKMLAKFKALSIGEALTRGKTTLTRLS